MREFDILQIEAQRIERQAQLDAERTQKEKNLAGQFATPRDLANSIAKYAVGLLAEKSPVFLEPSCGSGAFISAVVRSLDEAQNRLGAGYGVELDPRFASLASELWSDLGLRIISGDFLEIDESSLPKVNLVLANPPYVRHHHLTSDQKQKYREVCMRSVGHAPSGLSGLYVYFLLATDKFLDDNAVSAWLIPTEFLDTNYGKVLRQYLSRDVSLVRIHRFDPEGLQFDDALVTSSVVVFKKSKLDPQHPVVFSEGTDINHPEREVVFAQGLLCDEDRWSRYFRSVPSSDPAAKKAPILGDFFQVRRGIATGNNGYFIASRKDMESQGIDTHELRPVLPPPRRLRGEYIKADIAGWPLLDEQLVLLSSEKSLEELEQSNPELARYFQSADEKTLSSYIVRHRSPWYRVESRPPAPFLLTYMGRANGYRAAFRFILNESNGVATNGYLMVYPRGVLEEALQKGSVSHREVFEALNQLSDEAFIDGGRVYGGGLRKIEPRELMCLEATPIVELLENCGSNLVTTYTSS